MVHTDTSVVVASISQGTGESPDSPGLLWHHPNVGGTAPCTGGQECVSRPPAWSPQVLWRNRCDWMGRARAWLSTRHSLCLRRGAAGPFIIPSWPILAWVGMGHWFFLRSLAGVENESSESSLSCQAALFPVPWLQRAGFPGVLFVHIVISRLPASMLS